MDLNAQSYLKWAKNGPRADSMHDGLSNLNGLRHFQISVDTQFFLCFAIAEYVLE